MRSPPISDPTGLARHEYTDQDISDTGTRPLSSSGSCAAPKGHPNLRPFKRGVSGNPGGKPTGARNGLSAAFLNALQASFEKHGAEAIEACRTESPAKYLAIVASLVSKEMFRGGDSKQPVAMTISWLDSRSDTPAS